MNVYFAVFVLATLGSLLGEINAGNHVDTCQKSDRFKCYFGTSLTQANCPPICNWCPSLPNFRKCQTSNRACLHSDRKKKSSFTTETACEGAGFVWCGGDVTQECVQPEPVRKLCFKKFNVNSCPNTHTTEFSCNTDTTGCFWCDEGRPERLGQCWKLPVDCSGDSCCEQAPCRRTFTQTQCEDIGCDFCTEGVEEYCNFGPPAPLDPNVDVCLNSVIDRFRCYFGDSPTLLNCPPICTWCPDLTNFRKCQTSNRACLHTDRKINMTHITKDSCEGAGLVWCGGREIQECIHPEPVRELCFKLNSVDPCPTLHTTELTCNSDAAECFWCDEGRPERFEKCWKLTVDCSADSCCEQAPCRRTFTQMECEAIGCDFCTAGQEDYCNFGVAGQ